MGVAMGLKKTQTGLPNIMAHDAKFDILKFFLSLMVVAIHVPLFPKLLFPWLRMAVPLFFMLTGYFLYGKLRSEVDSQERLMIIKNFAMRNLKLYFFWFVCLFPLIMHIRKDSLFADTLFMTLISLCKVLLFGSTFTGSWYIMSGILGVLIVFFVLGKIPNKYLFGICAVLYVFLVLTSSYPEVLHRCDMISAFLVAYKHWLGSPTLTFPIAIVWLVCGKCFAEGFFRYQHKTYVWICLVSAVLLYAEWHFVRKLNGTYYNDCYLFLLPFCIGLFGWISSGKTINLPGAVHLKQCSTVIYAMHGAANRIGKAFFIRVLGIDSAVLCFMTSSVVCVLTYILIAWILSCKKNRVTRILRYAY